LEEMILNIADTNADRGRKHDKVNPQRGLVVLRSRSRGISRVFHELTSCKEMPLDKLTATDIFEEWTGHQHKHGHKPVSHYNSEEAQYL
jgi:hypothetical protein